MSLAVPALVPRRVAGAGLAALLLAGCGAEGGDDNAARQGRENSLDQYEKLGVDELALDVWVDAHDRFRRLRGRFA